MRELESVSCVFFADWSENDPNKKSYIAINKRSKCESYVGWQTDSVGQWVFLSSECVSKPGIIKHVLLHALGFYHQQSASNRDEYVRIKWKNIIKKYTNHFVKLNEDIMPSYGVQYDFDSIMHSPRDALSENGCDTIIPFVSYMKVTNL